MNTYTWSDLRDRAIDAYGEAPHGQLEQDILDVFKRHPKLVNDAVDRIAGRYQSGSVQKPWAVLRKDVVESATAKANPTVHDTSDRDATIRRGEQWLRTSGMHFDRHREITRELYGTQGRLRAYAADRTTRRRTRDLWRDLRPTGEHLEREHAARMSAYREHLAYLERVKAERAAQAARELEAAGAAAP